MLYILVPFKQGIFCIFENIINNTIKWEFETTIDIAVLKECVTKNVTQGAKRHHVIVYVIN